MNAPATNFRRRAPHRRPSGSPRRRCRETEVTAVVSGIGPRLRSLRTRHGLSLQQLADRSDVSPAAIHKVEQGTMVPTITTLLKLAAAFQVPVAHFIDEAGAPPRRSSTHRRSNVGSARPTTATSWWDRSPPSPGPSTWRPACSRSRPGQRPPRDPATGPRRVPRLRPVGDDRAEGRRAGLPAHRRGCAALPLRGDALVA